MFFYVNKDYREIFQKMLTYLPSWNGFINQNIPVSNQFYCINNIKRYIIICAYSYRSIFTYRENSFVGKPLNTPDTSSGRKTFPRNGCPGYDTKLYLAVRLMFLSYEECLDTNDLYKNIWFNLLLFSDDDHLFVNCYIVSSTPIK